MALVETLTATLAAIAIITVVTTWGLLKCLKWGLNAEREATVGGYAQLIQQLSKQALFLVVLVVTWDGLASWASGTWWWLVGMIP